MAEKQLNISEVELKIVNLRTPNWNDDKPYNLLPHLRELNIYESVFSNSLTANITLDEAVNLPEKMSIVGEERIEIDIHSPGMGDKFNLAASPGNPLVMFVHKTSNQQLKTPQSHSFALELVSEQYLSNAHSRVSKSYKGMKANFIALDIWSNYLKPYTRQMMGGIFEPTEHMEQCVIPNWTPYQAINWLAKRSVSKKYPKAANYVYFETLTGDFFRSLDSLMAVESVLLFTLEPAKVDPHKVDRFSGGVMPCEAIDIVHKPELIKNINRGLYSSKLITHDIVTKKIRQYDYRLIWGDKDKKNLNIKPPVKFARRQVYAGSTFNTRFAPPFDPKQTIPAGHSLDRFPDSLVMFAPKHDKMYAENPENEHDNKVEDWKLQRNSQMTLFDGIKFNVQCGGIPMLRVGMCVDIHMMSPQSHTKQGDDEDKSLSGKCMVTAIRHVLTNNLGNTEYKMWLELSKDGIGK